LPVPPTPLLGRQQDIAAISQLVSPSGGAARVLTLIGPGGVGKTRVALVPPVRRMRAAAGLTQEGLAERAGLSVRGIYDLERGARRVPHPD
jgi:hypothetical protein